MATRLFFLVLVVFSVINLNSALAADPAPQPTVQPAPTIPAGLEVPPAPLDPEGFAWSPTLALRAGGGYAAGLHKNGRNSSEGFGVTELGFALRYRVNDKFYVAPYASVNFGGNHNGFNRWGHDLGLKFIWRNMRDRVGGGVGVGWGSYDLLAAKQAGWWLQMITFPMELYFKPWDREIPWYFTIVVTPAAAANRQGHFHGYFKATGGIGTTFR